MKHFNEEPISVESEIQFLASYLGSRWTGIPGEFELLRDIQKAAALAAAYWFDDTDVSAQLLQKERSRISFLSSVLPAEVHFVGPQYDACTFLFSRMRGSTLTLVHAVRASATSPWDYSAEVQKLVSSLKTKYPDIGQAQPLQWVAMDPQEDWDAVEETLAKNAGTDEIAFSGFNTATVGNESFPYRTALAYVQYEFANYRRTPAECLISAVYSYFLVIQQELNNREFIAALGALDLPELVPEVVFEVNPTSSHLLTRVLLETSRMPEAWTPQKRVAEYETECNAALAFKAMTPAEQDAIRKVNEAEFEAFMSAEMAMAKIDQEINETEQRCLEALRRELAASLPGGTF